MEVKSVIMVLLIVGVVVPKTEATLCKDVSAYGACVLQVFFSKQDCASMFGCTLSAVENSGSMTDYYCKLGCASSVCGNIKIDGAGEGVGELNQSVKHCHHACYEICNKASKLQLNAA